MTPQVPDASAIADTLREAMLGQFDAEDFDIEIDQNETSVTLSTDDWTLFLDRSEQLTAWIALDDEPDYHLDVRTVLDQSLGASSTNAISDANERLERLISDALIQSNDRFSRIVADLLTDGAERPTER